MMKLFHELKLFLIFGICAGTLITAPISASATSLTSNVAHAQEVNDVTGLNDASDVAKGDTPKPSPKPGPRDGGADD